MPLLQIENPSPSQLGRYKRNARTHSKKQTRQIADSIRTFDLTNPVLIDSDSIIFAGQGRVEATMHIGLDGAPCVRLESMMAVQSLQRCIGEAAPAGSGVGCFCNEKTVDEKALTLQRRVS